MLPRFCFVAATQGQLAQGFPFPASVQEIVGVERVGVGLGGVAVLTLLNIAIKQSRDPDDFLFSI